MVYLPEHASLHSVSVRVALIHGFIQHDLGLKSAHLPFRNGITPLSALVWTRWDLNPGPPPCKGGDLPADLRALSRGLVWPTNLFLL